MVIAHTASVVALLLASATEDGLAFCPINGADSCNHLLKYVVSAPALVLWASVAVI